MPKMAPIYNLVLFLCLFGALVDSARILASIYSPSYSHQATFMPIWHELAKKHDLTVITTDPVKNAAFRQIDVSHSYKMMEELGMGNMVSNSNDTKTNTAFNYIDGLHKISDYQFGHPEIKALIGNKSEYFDLLMIEVIFPGQMAFVDRFKAPFIGLVSLDATTSNHRAVGNPTHPILYPDHSLSFTNNLNFKQRVISFVANILFHLFTYQRFYPKEDLNVQKHFEGFNIRPLREIERDMDLLFINLNPIFHQVRPLNPNTIHIGGGIHLKSSKALPQDLQQFLDKSKKGVIYFSLGTNVKTSLIDHELKKVIIKALSELPYDVLWKYEDEVENLPKNIKISKWIPQQDVFRHHKIKLFITQCGLQSTEEAISNGLPILGMPFFGDQHKNARIIQEKGLGLTVDRETLTVDTFKATILELITNQTFKNNVLEMADLMTDVQFTGLEKAVWWTEFVLRHKGAQHLRSPGVSDPFYIYYMLDVLAVLLLATIVPLYISWRFLKWILGKCFRRQGNTKVKKE